MSGFIRVAGYASLALFCWALATTNTVEVGWRVAAAGFGGGALVLAVWVFRDWLDA